MGITIFFKGTLQDKQSVNSLIDELVDISKIMNWKYDTLDEDWSLPPTAKLVHTDRGLEIEGYLALKGITIKVHPKAESLDIYFDSNGILTSPVNLVFTDKQNFIKTQFAPPDAHISIINLFKYLKKIYTRFRCI